MRSSGKNGTRLVLFALGWLFATSALAAPKTQAGREVRSAIEQYKRDLEHVPRNVAALHLSLIREIAQSHDTKTHAGKTYERTSNEKILSKVDATQQRPLVRRLLLQLRRRKAAIEAFNEPTWSELRLRLVKQRQLATIDEAIDKAEHALHDATHLDALTLRDVAESYILTLGDETPGGPGDMGREIIASHVGKPSEGRPSVYADQLLFHPLLFTDRPLDYRDFNRVAALRDGYVGLNAHGKLELADGAELPPYEFAGHDLRHHLASLDMLKYDLNAEPGSKPAYWSARGRAAALAYMRARAPRFAFRRAFETFVERYPEALDRRLAEVLFFVDSHEGAWDKIEQGPYWAKAEYLTRRLRDGDLGGFESDHVTADRIERLTADYERFVKSYRAEEGAPPSTATRE